MPDVTSPSYGRSLDLGSNLFRGGMHLNVATLLILGILVAIFAADPACAETNIKRGASGKLLNSTTHNPDGSRTVTYPGGLKETYNPDGSRRGKTRVCSNSRTGGPLIKCWYIEK